MKLTLTRGIVIVISLIVFIVLIVSFLKMGQVTYDTVKMEGVDDCEIKQGYCLEPIDGECPTYQISYKTLHNTNCEKEDKVCCIRG